MELLEASKHYYVKSEAVLDSKQELRNSEHLRVTSIPALGLLRKKTLKENHSQEASVKALILDVPGFNNNELYPVPCSTPPSPPPPLPPRSPRKTVITRLKCTSLKGAKSEEQNVEFQLKRLLVADPLNPEDGERSSHVIAGSLTEDNTHPIWKSSSDLSQGHTVCENNRQGNSKVPVISSEATASDSPMSEDEEHLRTLGFRYYEWHKPIFRSRSDISHRYFRMGSELSLSDKSAPSRDSDKLERFFDSMGLLCDDQWGADRKSRLSISESGSQPVFFGSVSSIDSLNSNNPRCSGPSGESPPFSKPGLRCDVLMSMKPRENSIVERNARVIKWLYNCHRAFAS